MPLRYGRAGVRRVPRSSRAPVRRKSESGLPGGHRYLFRECRRPSIRCGVATVNNFARIPVSGLIAHYNATGLPPGPDRLPLLIRAILGKRLTFRGFLYFDYTSQFPDFVTDMQGWLTQGRMKYREDITDGLENAPRELIRLLKGENFGKKIIRVSPDPTEEYQCTK